jgi:DNA primase
MISKEIIDKIMDAAHIEDVISDFVALRRRGANYVACCPFHNEKTPSFSVSPSKGIYKCFGCGKAGNAVNFVMEHEHLGYVEALKYLGRKYGIEVTDKEETKEEAERRLKSESVLNLLQFASDFFSRSLWESDQGLSVALSYLRSRGFSHETIKKFNLGWAPSGRNRLSETALKSGYKKEFLLASGLSLQREGSSDLADRFHDRVIFPIHSLSGRIIAFGGRILRTDKKTAKYINSPETEVYSKSNSLYGIFQSKSAISKLQNCYLVEGYTDVISLHQAGIENVVASSGTSLTTNQIRLIKRFTQNVTVLYDGDEAGIKASLRGIDMLLEEGLKVKVLLFPEGEDPDSFARKKEHEELKKFLEESAEDFISFKTKLLSSSSKNSPIERSRLIADIVASIAVIPDAISRAVYTEECANSLSISEDILIGEVNKLRKKRQYSAYTASRETPGEELGMPAYTPSLETGEKLPGFITDTYYEPAEKELLYYLIKFGEEPLYGKDSDTPSTVTVSEFILAELQNDELDLQNLLYKKIFDEYYKVKELSQEEIQRHFLNHQDSEIVKVVLDLLHQEHSLTIKMFIESVTPEQQTLSLIVPKSILIYKARITAKAYRNTLEELEKAEKEHNTEKQQELMKQVMILMHIRNSFAKELNRLTL